MELIYPMNGRVSIVNIGAWIPNLTYPNWSARIIVMGTFQTTGPIVSDLENQVPSARGGYKILQNPSSAISYLLPVTHINNICYGVTHSTRPHLVHARKPYPRLIIFTLAAGAIVMIFVMFLD